MTCSLCLTLLTDGRALLDFGDGVPVTCKNLQLAMLLIEHVAKRNREVQEVGK